MELDLLLAIGTPLIALHGWGAEPVSVTYERAGVLCEKLDEDERLVTMLFGLASNRVVKGQTRDAQLLAERCRIIAERRGSRVDRMLAHRAMGVALMQFGELRHARAEFEAISPLYDPYRDRTLAARCVTDPRATGLGFLALTLWIMGYAEQAQRVADDASRCAAELKHANTIGQVLRHAVAERAILRGDVPEVQRCADAVLELAAAQNMRMLRGYGLVFRGWAFAAQGQPADGAVLVREGIGELDTLTSTFHRTWQLGLLAGIEGQLGDTASGLRVLAEAYDEVARTEVRLFAADLHRTEGELQLMAGRPDAAERSFIAALSIARGQEARSFELRAAISLARLWRNQGRNADAHDILAPIHGWFTEVCDSPDLTSAGRLLEALR